MNNYTQYFSNPMLQWADIRSALKGKSGVYTLINNVTGDAYVGSAVDLNSRLRDYWQVWYQRDRGNTLIVRAMLKYGIENFSIGILEFTEAEEAVRAEQYWIDTLKPVYNILPIAASSMGYKHRAEDIEKISKAMTGKPRSGSVRDEMSVRQSGASNTFYGQKHTDEAKAKLRLVALSRTSDPKPGSVTTVHDNVTGLTTKYKSIRAVTRLLGCSIATVKNFDGKLYRDRYTITISK